MTMCMDVYKAKIQLDRSLEKSKLRIVIRGELKNKDLIGDTWSPAFYEDFKILIYICY